MTRTCAGSSTAPDMSLSATAPSLYRLHCDTSTPDVPDLLSSAHCAMTGHRGPAMADYNSTEFIAWLTASCERQGVPVTVTDPTVITQVATLLRPHTQQARRHDRPAQRSQTAKQPSTSLRR
jgi:hypothetical protein